MGALVKWLARRADNVAVGLLAATFFIFFLQVFSRYLFRPLGWTLEACLLAWLWLVFWSGAFTLRESDHVRFTIVLDAMRPPTRRVFALIASFSMIAAFASSLPATVDFVSFMKIEKTSLLKVPFDMVFSVYVIFSVAIIIRYGFRIVAQFRDRP
ncbi:MAG: TRAP transporter small permease [Paracoccaceae bacterium]